MNKMKKTLNYAIFIGTNIEIMFKEYYNKKYMIKKG